MNKYVNLDTKTSYSFFKSLITIDKLIEIAKKEGIKTLSIADKGNLYGAIDFYFECVKNGIKPIIGIELEEGNNKVVLYAKNRKGFDELIALSYLQLENDNLAKQNKIIEKLSSLKDCIIIDKSNTILNLKGDNYFIAKMPLQAREDDDRLVAFPSARMFAKKQAKALHIFELIGQSKKISEEPNQNYDLSLDYLYNDADFEGDFSKAELDNLIKIVNSIDIKIETTKENLLNFETKSVADKKLHELCVSGLKAKKLDDDKTYVTRLESELNIITNLGFSNYFLVVSDYVNFAKKAKISVGPGRGSVGGSLVAYVLSITNVDPIKSNLLFERFLNPERISMPDIDIDFEDERRDEVVNYVLEKYGKEHVAHIVTFQTLKAKMSIRDVGRVLDVDPRDVDSLAKLVPDDFSLIDIYKDSTTFKNAINSSSLKKELFEIACQIEGNPRQPGLHAAGIVLASDLIKSHIPIESIGPINRTQVSMDFLEKLGLYKMDILGLRTLTVIENVLKTIKAETGKDIDLNKINFDDPKVYETIAKANTLGIFQLETPGARKALRQIKPTSFEDIVATTSLNRPGPQEFIKNYVARKEGRESIEYYDPSLKNVLEKTYGIIVYQEQIMQISQEFANLSFSKADILRRAISKKDASQIEKLKQEFFDGATSMKRNKETINRVYSAIEKFADYGFNRSHAYAYSIVSYQMAYLKTYYYKQFYQDLLSSSIANKSKMVEYFNELEHFGIKPAYPDINKHFFKFDIDDKNVYVPIVVVNGIGNIAVLELETEVKENGPFKDFFDFNQRISKRKVNKKVVASLIDCGALDKLSDLTRKAMHQNIELVNKYHDLSVDKKTGKALNVPKPVLTNVPEFDNVAQLEIDALGFLIKSSTANVANVKEIAAKAGVELTSIADLEVGAEATIFGTLTSIRAITTKTGAQMAFATLQDSSANISLTIFPNIYKAYIDALKRDGQLIVSGKLEIKASKQFVVSKLANTNQ